VGDHHLYGDESALPPDPAMADCGHMKTRTELIRALQTIGQATRQEGSERALEERRVMSAIQCPLYPRKQTLELNRGMSALCQKQTHALQQNTVIRSRRRRAREDCAALRARAPWRW